MFFRVILSIIFLYSINFCKGQKKTQALGLKGKKFFTEQNVILPDTITSVLQDICYDVPEISDEAYCLKLKIIILDSLKAIKLKSFDVIKDSAIIHCRFRTHSFMPEPVNGAKIELSGTIDIISWKKDSLRLKMKLKVFDKDWNHLYFYNGVRNFIRKPYKKNCC